MSREVLTTNDLNGATYTREQGAGCAGRERTNRHQAQGRGRGWDGVEREPPSAPSHERAKDICHRATTHLTQPAASAMRGCQGQSEGWGYAAMTRTGCHPSVAKPSATSGHSYLPPRPRQAHRPPCNRGVVKVKATAAALRPRHACRMRRARRRAGSAATATAAKDAHSGRRPNAWRSCSASFGAWPSGGTGSAASVALAACTENKRRTRKQRRRHERARACEREREP